MGEAYFYPTQILIFEAIIFVCKAQLEIALDDCKMRAAKINHDIST